MSVLGMAGVEVRADLGEVERAIGFDVEIEYAHGWPLEENGRAPHTRSHLGFHQKGTSSPVSCLSVGGCTGVPSRPPYPPTMGR